MVSVSVHAELCRHTRRKAQVKWRQNSSAVRISILSFCGMPLQHSTDKRAHLCTIYTHKIDHSRVDPQNIHSHSCDSEYGSLSPLEADHFFCGTCNVYISYPVNQHLCRDAVLQVRRRLYLLRVHTDLHFMSNAKTQVF